MKKELKIKEESLKIPSLGFDPNVCGDYTYSDNNKRIKLKNGNNFHITYINKVIPKNTIVEF